jgi:hypothetical protein
MRVVSHALLPADHGRCAQPASPRPERPAPSSTLPPPQVRAPAGGAPGAPRRRVHARAAHWQRPQGGAERAREEPLRVAQPQRPAAALPGAGGEVRQRAAVVQRPLPPRAKLPGQVRPRGGRARLWGGRGVRRAPRRAPRPTLRPAPRANAPARPDARPLPTLQHHRRRALRVCADGRHRGVQPRRLPPVAPAARDGGGIRGKGQGQGQGG